MSEKLKNPTHPLVLGLSHIYGETADLDAQAVFWQARGMRLDFNWRLPIPREKHQTLLYDQGTSFVDLSYLSFEKPVVCPGVEFVRHQPVTTQLARKANPSITLVRHGSTPENIVDADGNRMILYPDANASATVVALTGSAEASGNLLGFLGFRKIDLERKEIDALVEYFPGVEAGWFLRLPLFPNLAARIILVEDKTRHMNPRIDEIGWSGLSFLVRSLDGIEPFLPLKARQKITANDGVAREIAFYNDRGLLLEFLEFSAK